MTDFWKIYKFLKNWQIFKKLSNVWKINKFFENLTDFSKIDKRLKLWEMGKFLIKKLTVTDF